jgi:hypothetical protein
MVTGDEFAIVLPPDDRGVIRKEDTGSFQRQATIG